jgi:hypothetical protein
MGERVNYLCQRCQQPLRLDPSLLSLDEHTLAELSLPITPTPNHHQLVSQVFIYRYPSRPSPQSYIYIVIVEDHIVVYLNIIFVICVSLLWRQ